MALVSLVVLGPPGPLVDPLVSWAIPLYHTIPRAQQALRSRLSEPKSLHRGLDYPAIHCWHHCPAAVVQLARGLALRRVSTPSCHSHSASQWRQYWPPCEAHSSHFPVAEPQHVYVPSLKPSSTRTNPPHSAN